jgi:Iap family predicted aminopeptidase
MKKWLALLLSMSVVVTSVFGCGQVSKDAKEDVRSTYLQKVNTQYGYDVAMKLLSFRTNEKLGFRPAGSNAEHEAADMLYDEMKKIGLKDVTKDEFKVDSWEYKSGSLEYQNPQGKTETLELGGYQTEFDYPKGLKAELVYAGKGTKQDLQKLDVKGKIVLIDIDMRSEWWITFPAYQAHLKGAVAVICNPVGGYGMVNDDALNSQDICGPKDAPAFSMSRNSAKKIKDMLNTQKGKALEVSLKAESKVERDGKSYNIVGTILGKNQDELLIVGDHYDAYYDGFQDNAMAGGLTLGIAKALIESGYQPEKTIVFILHGAEEWGAIDTRYDWSTGA